MEPNFFFRDFTSSLGVNRPLSYVSQLNMNSLPHEIDASYLAGPIYVPSWEYRRDQSLMEPKVAMSFFENLASPGTRSSVSHGYIEHVRDMYKIKLVEHIVLGQEILRISR